MTKEEISAMLQGMRGWDGADQKAKDAFCTQMHGRQYGLGPLTSAWHWFLSGWNGYTE